jgi:hypothetical protein
MPITTGHFVSPGCPDSDIECCNCQCVFCHSMPLTMTSVIPTGSMTGCPLLEGTWTWTKVAGGGCKYTGTNADLSTGTIEFNANFNNGGGFAAHQQWFIMKLISVGGAATVFYGAKALSSYFTCTSTSLTINFSALNTAACITAPASISASGTKANNNCCAAGNTNAKCFPKKSIYAPVGGGGVIGLTRCCCGPKKWSLSISGFSGSPACLTANGSYLLVDSANGCGVCNVYQWSDTTAVVVPTLGFASDILFNTAPGFWSLSIGGAYYCISEDDPTFTCEGSLTLPLVHNTSGCTVPASVTVVPA